MTVPVLYIPKLLFHKANDVYFLFHHSKPAYTICVFIILYQFLKLAIHTLLHFLAVVTIGFVETVYSVNEDAGSVTVCISATGGQLTTSVVTVTAVQVTATGESISHCCYVCKKRNA